MREGRLFKIIYHLLDKGYATAPELLLNTDSFIFHRKQYPVSLFILLVRYPHPLLLFFRITVFIGIIKVPLSLLTLMLDNRKEEMSQTVYQRLVYVASQIQDNVKIQIANSLKEKDREKTDIPGKI